MGSTPSRLPRRNFWQPWQNNVTCIVSPHVVVSGIALFKTKELHKQSWLFYSSRLERTQLPHFAATGWQLCLQKSAPAAFLSTCALEQWWAGKSLKSTHLMAGNLNLNIWPLGGKFDPSLLLWPLVDPWRTTSLGLATRRRIAWGYWECIGKGIARLNTPPGLETGKMNS